MLALYWAAAIYLILCPVLMLVVNVFNILINKIEPVFQPGSWFFGTMCFSVGMIIVIIFGYDYIRIEHLDDD